MPAGRASVARACRERRQHCSAGCHRRWTASQLRARGMLVRLVTEAGDRCGHFLCRPCAEHMVQWATRNRVSYLRCPLCRMEITALQLDGGGGSREQRAVWQMAAEVEQARRAAAEREREAAVAAREMAAAQELAEERQHLRSQLMVELHSVEELNRLRDLLWVLAVGRPRNLPISRRDPRVNDRFLEQIGATFPVVATLCTSGSDNALVARDIVFQMVEEHPMMSGPPSKRDHLHSSLPCLYRRRRTVLS